MSHGVFMTCIMQLDIALYRLDVGVFLKLLNHVREMLDVQFQPSLR